MIFVNKRRLTAIWRLGPRLLQRLGGCCSIIFKTRRDKKDVHGSIRLKREDESGDIDLWPPAAFLPHLSRCRCAQRHGFPARGGPCSSPVQQATCPHVMVAHWHLDTNRGSRSPSTPSSAMETCMTSRRMWGIYTWHSGSRPWAVGHFMSDLWPPWFLMKCSICLLVLIFMSFLTRLRILKCHKTFKTWKKTTTWEICWQGNFQNKPCPSKVTQFKSYKARHS